MELIRAERIIIKPDHASHAACKRYCGVARRVYNAALYPMRQALFAEAPISASQADKVLKQTQRETYPRLPSAGAQRTTQVLGDNWKGWIAAKKDFEKHPHKYTSRPKLPTKLNPDHAFSIDLGIDNLVTIVSTQQDYAPVLIKGKAIKSIKAKYNKAKYNKLNAQLMSNSKRKEIGDDWLISQIEAGQGVMDTPVAVRHIDLLLEAGLRPRETTSNREAA